MNFSGLLRNLALKNLSSVFGCPKLIYQYKYVSRYDTVSFSNLATMILSSIFVKLHTYWEPFSWNFTNWSQFLVNISWFHN